MNDENMWQMNARIASLCNILCSINEEVWSACKKLEAKKNVGIF